MENWIQIGNDQKNKIKKYTESERRYIIQSSVSVWITAQGEIQTDSDDIRMNQIINYVNGNYQNHMSLSELAGELFVATSTLSTFPKADRNEVCRISESCSNSFCGARTTYIFQNSYQDRSRQWIFQCSCNESCVPAVLSVHSAGIQGAKKRRAGEIPKRNR